MARNFALLSTSLQDALHLVLPPVAVTLGQTPPAGVAPATKTVAAGCVSERRKTVAILEEGALAPPDAQAALVGGDGGPAPVYRRPRSKGAIGWVQTCMSTRISLEAMAALGWRKRDTSTEAVC